MKSFSKKKISSTHNKSVNKRKINNYSFESLQKK